MKFSQDNYETLKTLVSPVMADGLTVMLAVLPKEVEPQFTKYAWQFFWQARPEAWLRENNIYDVYTDNHIQTALMKILHTVMKDIMEEAQRNEVALLLIRGEVETIRDQLMSRFSDRETK